jgi:uncharacterized protein involved in exopolysaccharide biosynthesis
MEIRWYYKIIRYSALIIIFSILIPAIAALLLSLSLPAEYQTQAEVVLFKSKTDINLDPRFETISEDELIRLSGQDPRRQTLSALAVSDQVLSETISSLPEQIQSNWTLIKLGNRVSVETSGNLLQLITKANEPNETAIVNNTWAETFTRVANQTFRQSTEALDTLIAQVGDANYEYQLAENNLITFLEDNQIDDLTLEIKLIENAVSDLRQVFQSDARAELETTLQVSQRIKLLVSEAETLRALLEETPKNQEVSPSIQTAILILLVNATNFGQITPGDDGISIPTDIQLSIPYDLANPLTADTGILLLNQIIEELTALENQFEQSSRDQGTDLLNVVRLDGNLSDQIQFLHNKKDKYNAKLEEEQAVIKELTAARDLAWENFKILSQKAAELNIVDQTAETEVVFATRAIPPIQPSGPNTIIYVGIGVVLGLFIGLSIAIIRAHLNEDLSRGFESSSE